MLISFKIENYRSIKDPVIIDFNTVKKFGNNELPDNSFKVGNENLLKSIILYGRNASGKSNLLRAFDEFKDIVCDSDTFKHGQLILEYLPYEFDSETKNKPTTFEAEFYGVKTFTKYLYSISFNSYEIVEESLFFYPQGVKTKLFTRSFNKINYGDSFRGNKKEIESNLLKNQLFLSKSATNNFIYLDEVYLTLSTQFNIAINNFDFVSINMIEEEIRLNLNDEKLKTNLKKLLQCGDTGLMDYKLGEKSGNHLSMMGTIAATRFYDESKNKDYDMRTVHRMFDKGKESGLSELDISEESLGTQKLITLGLRIIDTLTFGGIMVIDEIDKGLHPLLTRMLIKLFHSKKNNPKNAQLIFATHDGTLMDLELFRRDQICFIEKEYEGNTTITKLSDYRGVRKGIPLEKWYLSGRFKGIPVINDVELEF